MPGYVYLMTNPSMPGVVKVGRTARPPAERLEELSRATGIPTPFQLVYDILVPDAERAEKVLHDLLGRGGHRVSDNREFFRVPVREALSIMLQLREGLPAERVGRPGLGSVVHEIQEKLGHATIAEEILEERDELFLRAARLAQAEGYASTTLLQRRLGVGYGRAARIIDQMHRAGITGPYDAASGRSELLYHGPLDEIPD